MSEGLETIEGSLERIVFHNEDSGYVVGRLAREDGDPVSIVGNMPAVSPGETLRLSGHWEKNPRYGLQFKVENCQPIYPVTAEGIKRYLASGLIRGIGPVMAGRIVDLFGTETIRIIEEERRRLAEVPGVGRSRMEMISRAWDEHKDIKDIMLFLQGHGIGSAYAVRIYKAYGKDTLNLVRRNPYRLAEDIFGIGFRMADGIALRLGLPEDAPERLKAALLYRLKSGSDEGHVYLPTDILLKEAAQALTVDERLLSDALESLRLEGTVVVEARGGEARVYQKPLYQAEREAAEAVRRLRTDDEGDYPGIPTVMAGAKGDIRLSQQQVEAVEASMRNRLLVVTGGPGTGKTTIIKAIIALHQQAGHRVALCAPTGRAAKRMTQATGRDARTIHRLLEFSPMDGCFKRNGQNPLETDLVIADEASMMDIILACHLLRALPPRAGLILVGDTDQLPSVGPGNFLRDVIGSGGGHVVRLNRIYRQSESSLIVTNAHRINSGRMPLPSGKDGDFFFIQEDDPERVRDIVIQLCAERLPRRYLLDPFDDIQVLAPMHRGVAGTVSLNEALQEKLNPHGREMVRGGRKLRCGDKVMQLVNNYDTDVYNGDIGRVCGIDPEEQQLLVEFDGRRVAYDFGTIDELSLAYAVSVHKSQGSEYPAVVLPLLTQHYMMLQRNLVYTAVTRASRLLVMVGSLKALHLAVGNSRVSRRYSGLPDALAEGPVPPA